MSWMNSVVVPINDAIDHDEFSEDCPCGPTPEPVKRDDGSMGWVLVHHSLDGREIDDPTGA